MNDEELRMKLGRLRTPTVTPAALERALARAARTLEEADLVGPCADAAISDRMPDNRTGGERAPISNAWTWRDWLWPSPFAWGALAVVWAAYSVMSLSTPPADKNASAPAEGSAARVFRRPPLRLAQKDARSQLQELKRLTQIQ